MAERRARRLAIEFGAGARRLAARATAALRDLARGVSGTHAYDQYVAHCRAHHPDRPIPSREAFFRRELTEKWEGVRRCC